MRAKKKRYARGSGIAVEHRDGRVSPWLTKWKVAKGKFSHEAFASQELALAKAEALNRAFLSHGQNGLEFTSKELNDWRAFRSLIGENTSLDEVSLVWKQHRKFSDAKLGPMIEQFLADYQKKRPESTEGLAHLKPVMFWIEGFFGSDKSVASIDFDDARRLFDHFPSEVRATYTKQTWHKKARQFFNYLVRLEVIPKNKLLAVDMPVLTEKEEAAKEILTPSQIKALFYATAANVGLKNRKEIIGRLALECFSGMRHSTAGRIEGSSVDTELKLVSVKAQWDKKGRRYELNQNGPEQNLWAWLEYSEPSSWNMKAGSYTDAKRDAFTRIGFVRPKNPPHNVLRHSFATYHVSLKGDAGKTATILNHHGSIALLKRHYLQESMSGPIAQAYFDILPPDAIT